MSEKTEKATPYRLKKAKEQGRVNKSNELNTCIFLLVMLAIASALWPSVLLQLKQWIMRLLMMSTHFAFSVDSVMQLQHILFSQLSALWLPFAMAAIITLISASIAQTGFVWSFTPITPNFQRMNIIDGCKRLFSTKILFETVKNILKLTFASLVLTISIKHELITCLHLITKQPNQLPSIIAITLGKILLHLLLLLFAIACIDKFYTRWKYAKDNRMSKQDIIDEYRQREGDPKIKAKIKQLHQQQRQKTASLASINTADVIIKHANLLAIALKYDKGQMPAPKVICKGQGDLAKQITQIAAQYHIPLVENKPLAEALFSTTQLNQWINRDLFPLVAPIFRDLYRKKAAQ
jgi:flagellar biosynthetic protein FlhB